MGYIFLVHYYDCLNNLLEGLSHSSQGKLAVRVDLVVEQIECVLCKYGYLFLVLATAITVKNQRVAELSQKLYAVFDTGKNIW